MGNSLEGGNNQRNGLSGRLGKRETLSYIFSVLLLMGTFIGTGYAKNNNGPVQSNSTSDGQNLLIGNEEEFIKEMKKLVGYNVNDSDILSMYRREFGHGSSFEKCKLQMTQLEQTEKTQEIKSKIMIIDDIVELKSIFNKAKIGNKDDIVLIKQGYDRLVEKIKNHVKKYGKGIISESEINDYFDEKNIVLYFKGDVKYRNFFLFIRHINDILGKIGGFEILNNFINLDNYSATINSFNVQKGDIDSLVRQLANYGRVDYREFKGNKSGPVLVIFPEIHFHSDVLSENYNAISNTLDYYKFLATEGNHGEITFKDKSVSDNSFEKNVELLGISSHIIEAKFDNKIKTFGVESSSFGSYYPYDIFQDNDNYVINLRNNLWLKNIILLLHINKNENGKNIVPLVCGAAHMDDLIKQSEKMGFKGVIVFNSDILSKKYDKESLGKIVDALKLYLKDICKDVDLILKNM